MKNSNYSIRKNGVKEKTYIILKVGTISQTMNDKILDFLQDFLVELKQNGHNLAQKPIRNISADDEKHASELLRSIRDINIDFLLVLFEDEQFMNIKQRLRRNQPNLNIFSIKTSFISSLTSRRGHGKLVDFCQQFAQIVLNDNNGNAPGPSQNYQRQTNGSQAFRNVEKTGNSTKKYYPIGYPDIEKICNDLDTRKLLVGSSDLFTFVNKPSYFDRLNELWPEPDKQSKLLQTIVATASSAQADLLTLTHEFLKKVVESKIIEFLVDKHVFQVMIDSKKRTPIYGNLFDHLVSLLVLGLEMLPSSMDRHLKQINEVLSTLQNPIVQGFNFLKEETNRNLERLNTLLQTRITAKAEEITKQDSKRSNAEFQGSRGAPPEDFRKLSIMPTIDDIIYSGHVFLRPALKLGQYENNEHYLDVQFRLMREDLLRPLRDGIVQYRKDGVKGTDLFVYRNVKVESSVLHKQTGELMNKAKLQIGRRMRWNKRLKFGSLVCLSNDDFRNHFIFATVLDRDDLQTGIVGLKFENPREVDPKREYSMVESPAFYECYKYVMMALQSIPENGEVPFSKYLVDVDTNNQYPRYLVTTGLQLDFEVLMKIKRTFKVFNVPRLITILSPAEFGMDKSQFEALHYALTSNLAVIQGPPGTGKTYIGLQIARLLFANEHAWNSESKTPMLVVCYTNHALDQFLEGMLKFLKTGIVRIGGRCKNPALEEFTLLKVRQKAGSHHNHAIYRNLQQERFKLINTASELTCNNNILKEFRSGLISPEFLKTAMQNFKGGNLLRDLEKRSHALFHWLTYGKRRDVKVPDINTIRQLMQKGFSEIAVKNAMHQLPEANEIFGNLNEAIKFWPKIRDIDQLKRNKINEEVALQMLLSTNGDLQKVQENLRRFKEIVRDPILLENPGTQQNIIDEDFGLYRDEDDDRDRIMNFDLQEFLAETKAKNKKDENDESWFTPGRMTSFAKHIASAPPMMENEVNAIQDIWALSLQDRWRLYQLWIKFEKRTIKQNIAKLETNYSESVKRLAELKALNDIDVLRSSKVIGMTTTGAAMHQAALRALKPKIVIIEEAAEVLEAHVLTSLTTACEHAILIGDHKQLRPNPSVYELAKKYNLEISLFERLINNDYPYKMLENQHRMRPTISKTLMPHFYPSLKDDVSVQGYPHIDGINGDMFFISHNYPEVNDPELKSHSNPFEAEYAVRLARYLRQQSYQDEEITILCTYLEQLIEIRKLAIKILGEKHGVRIENVDNYQGEECEIIILSLVRSNNQQNKIGFLNIDNRVCVALSRAKRGLYVLANMEFLAEKCELWKNIKKSVDDVGALTKALPVKCQIHGEKQQIEHYSEFDEKCPEGGCKRPCNVRLDCGHTCTKPCHSYDKDHQEIPCTKDCARTCDSIYKHPCKKRCYQPCGDCRIKVEKHLLCGHTKLDACHLPPQLVHCVEKCVKKLRCGHPCENQCSADCTTVCKVEVLRRLPNCGHPATIQCSTDPTKVKCKTLVEKEFPVCKHKVEVECYVDVNNTECQNPCNMPLPDCEHICKGTCGTCRNGRLHIRCQENCTRILICGHECTAKCSRVCPPCTKACETACAHSQCSQVAPNGEDPKKVREGGYNVDKQRKKKGRLCGDPCPPCAEKCLNECEHLKCSKHCYEPCDVGPCMEPCKKKLKCSTEEEPHFCIGICGEDCPSVCKICDKDKEKFEEAQAIFFGTEDDEDARFVQLKDCGHLLEVSGLDQWINNTITASGENSDVAIVTITCPKCKTPIRRSKRYVSILNQRAIDIEQIKDKLKGKKKNQLENEWATFKTTAQNRLDASSTTLARCYSCSKTKPISQLPKDLLEVFKDYNVKNLNQGWLETCENVLRIMDRLDTIANEFIQQSNSLNVNCSNMVSSPKLRSLLSEFKITNLLNYLWDDLYELLKIITGKDVRFISESMLQQLVSELERIEFIYNMFKWIVKLKEYNRDIDFNLKNNTSTLRTAYNYLIQRQENHNVDGDKLRLILTLLNSPFEEKNKELIKANFNDLVKMTSFSGLAISEKDRLDIVKALSYSSSNPHGVKKWYKCPNGHLYGIGDCGQAMVKARCPECKAVIGGERHHLEATNQEANEMTRGANIPEIDPWVPRW